MKLPKINSSIIPADKQYRGNQYFLILKRIIQHMLPTSISLLYCLTESAVDEFQHNTRLSQISTISISLYNGLTESAVDEFQHDTRLSQISTISISLYNCLTESAVDEFQHDTRLSQIATISISLQNKLNLLQMNFSMIQDNPKYLRFQSLCRTV